MDRFRRMEIFVAVVDTGQLTRAAEVLRLSKSAVSHALTDLEKYLDLQLIVRHNRKWHLTKAGATYYAQSKKLLAHVTAMENEVRQESKTLKGLIRISASITYGSYILVPIIAKFTKIHPNILIELNLTDSHVDMIEKRVDISFLAGRIKNRFLEAHKVAEFQMMMCASPEYIKEFGQPKTHLDLKNHKCIRYTQSPHWRLIKNDRRYEFMPKDHILSDSGEMILGFGLHGQGVVYLPSMLTDIPIKQGTLVKVLTDYECETMPIHAVRTAGNRASNRVVELLDYIVAERYKRKLVSEVS